jgi:D-ribose pyranase
MKKHGIINAPLAAQLTGLRHTNLFAVCDSGLAAPPGATVIDLSLVYGVPTVSSVLSAILAEVVVEAAWIAEEISARNPQREREIRAELGDLVPAAVPHDELRALLPDVRFFVRTGDDRPYSNVVLRAGVGFPV